MKLPAVPWDQLETRGDDRRCSPVLQEAQQTPKRLSHYSLYATEMRMQRVLQRPLLMPLPAMWFLPLLVSQPFLHNAGSPVDALCHHLASGEKAMKR